MSVCIRTAWRVAVVAALSLVSLPPLASAQAPSAAELARGKYVFGATGGCGCHTVPKGPVNAGGRRYDGPFGTVYSSNITPDKETGIGGWTDEQIITATRLGRRPNGERLIPVHPYTTFNGMAAESRLRALEAGKDPDEADQITWTSSHPRTADRVEQAIENAGLTQVSHPVLDADAYLARINGMVYGDDPNQCVFESYALERFPEGEEPETEWTYAEATGENWGSVLAQDFSNMEFVQKGMKSSGFRGPLPNPHQEQKVINLHRNLADWMEGRGAVTIVHKN